MKIKHRALSILLSLVMVLTFMPAMAFAAAPAGVRVPTAIEYSGDTEYEPASDGGNAYFMGFGRTGNVITIKWSDNTAEKYVSKSYSGKNSDGETWNEVDYFPENEDPKVDTYDDGGQGPANNLEGLNYTVNDQGTIELTYTYDYDYEYEEDGETYYDSATETVKTTFKGKTANSLSYSGPALTYEPGDSGRWVDLRQEGAVITVGYTDGTSKKAVCKKWGTNKHSDGTAYDEYDYFFEGDTPDVKKSDEGNNYADNAVYFNYDTDQNTATGMTVSYMGASAVFPISEKVYPKPTKAEFVPAKGFQAKALIGQDWFDASDLFSKGNKIVVTYSDKSKETFTYGKYKLNSGDSFEGFGYKTEDGWINSVWPDFGSNRSGFKKGTTTAKGSVSIWPEGYDKEFKLPITVKVKASDYYAYAVSDTYTYTGKTITPKVKAVYVAKDNGKMKKLSSSKYSYKPKKAKKIGSYKFKVNLKSKADQKKYGKSLLCWYSIGPKTPTGITVTPGSKKLTVKWKKQSGVDGFTVLVSKQKSFREIIAWEDAGKNAKSKVIKNLEKGKTYYVRVVAHKNGVWSKESKTIKKKTK